MKRHRRTDGSGDGMGVHRPGLGMRSRLVVSIGLLCVGTMLAVYVGLRNGVPYTGFSGRAEAAREAAFELLVSIAGSKKAHLEELFDRQRALAQQMESVAQFRTDVSDLRGIIQATGGRGEAWPSVQRSGSYGRVRDNLLAVYRSYRVYERIEILNPGVFTVMVSTDESRLGFSVPWFEGYYERMPFHGESLFFSARDPEMMRSHFHVARLVTVGDGGSGRERTVGILVMHLRGDLYLEEYINAREGLGRTGEVMLVDGGGRALLPPRFRLEGGTSPGVGHRIRARHTTLAARGQEGLMEDEDYRGRPVIAAFRYIQVNPETGWGLVVKRDVEEVFGPVRREELFYFTVTSLATVLFLFITYTLVSGTIRPVERLEGVARRVRSGEMAARAPLEGPKETRYLAQSLNSMIQRIQAWHEDLEKEVSRRTVELRNEIAKRKKTEEELKGSEARSRSILETAQEAIITCDSSGVVTGWNRAAQALFGYAPGEIVGRPAWKIMPEPYREGHETGMSRLREGGEPRVMGKVIELEGLRKSGEVFPLEISLAAWDSGGGTEFTAVIRDITMRRRMELQMAEVRKLEGLGSLAGGIAHHFNNLFMGITGNVALAAMKLPAGDPAVKHLEKIESMITRAALLVSQLQTYAGRAGAGPPGGELMDLNDLIRNLGELFAVTVPRTVSVVVELSEGGIPVRGDAAQIRHAVMSLIRNAAASSPDEGTITVTTSVRMCDRQCLSRSSTLDDLPEGLYAFLEVSDTGSVLDRETLERIFDPFYSTWDEGGGPGLAMVQGVARSFGGMVQVESERGKGTVFRLALPYAGEKGPSGPSARPGTVSGRGG